MMTVAEQIAVELKKAGVTYMFGIPGGPTIPLMEALKGVGIEFILVSNEAAGGIAADISGRLTGIPGVCHATFGPGVTNLSTGIGGALLDRSPLVAFTSEQPDELLNRTVQMQVDQQAFLEPLTKWTTRLTRENCVRTIRKAFAIAASEVPGPVNIGLPSDICLQEAIISEEDDDDYHVVPAVYPPVDWDHVQGVLRQSRRPILAFGLTAARLCSEESLRTLVESLDIPVVLTPMAKGLIPEDHPCYAGVVFHAKSDMVSNIYNSSDLVIGFGYDPIEFNYESWIPDAPVLHFDTVALDIDPRCSIAGNIVCNLPEAVAGLIEIGPLETTWDKGEIAGNREAMQKQILGNGTALSPVDVLAALREALPENGIMTCDVGAHTHLIGQVWKTPGRNVQIMTNGWSSMGFGVPAAVGSKMVKPEVPVTCVTGDGGFFMNCGELITARRYGLSIVFVVMNDSDLSLIKVKQKWKEVPPYAVKLFNDELFGADCFLGVPVLAVESRNELHDVFARAFAADGPVIVDARIDGSVYQDLISREYK